ncbi:MAG: tetrahydromethanopterin S-methyltransferase subunit H [Candidatus Bathyarchaeia archaeon]
MFKFSTEQKVFEIGRVKVGGQPGQLPPVMVGSIFYSGHRVVEDEKGGLFNRVRARELLEAEADISEKTALPRIIDVVGNHPEALVKYIDFVAEVTEDPFLVDGITAQVRIPAVAHIREVGLEERAVYNSLAPAWEEAEVEALKASGIKAAVLQATNARNPTVAGRVQVLKDSAQGPGLTTLASRAGVEKMLVDTSVMDTPDIGVAARAVYEVKRETGLPAGLGPSNAISTWKQLRKFEPEVLKGCDAATQAFPIAIGANFILYGPISNAKYVYPACALAAAYVEYSMRQEGIRPLVAKRPLTVMMR